MLMSAKSWLLQSRPTCWRTDWAENHLQNLGFSAWSSDIIDFDYAHALSTKASSADTWFSGEMLLKLNKQDCAIFLLLGRIISWANFVAILCPFHGQQHFPKESSLYNIFLQLGKNISQEEANISYFGQQYFPGEGNSGEKLAENWKLPSVTSTLRPVVNSNRTCAQSPHKFKLRAKSTQFRLMFGKCTELKFMLGQSSQF